MSHPAGLANALDPPRPTWVRWRVVALLLAFSFLSWFNRVSMSAAYDEQIKGPLDVSEEEIGYVGRRLDKLAEFYNSPGFCDEYTHLFLATELEERTRAAVSHEEAAMTIERVPLDRVDGLIASGELVDAKSIIGLLLARQFLAR